jgi:hypothetical protein
MNEELKELVEEMQEFLHKGNKLVNKAKKHLGMPMNGMGQRNFPHDLPPAFPQYPGEYDQWMSKTSQGFGERGGGMSGGMSGGMGERNQSGYNNREGGGYDPRYM